MHVFKGDVHCACVAIQSFRTTWIYSVSVMSIYRHRPPVTGVFLGNPAMRVAGGH